MGEMCSDATCSEKFGLAGGPACVSAGSTVQQKTVVKTSATISFDKSGRRLSSARLLSEAQAQLEAKIADVLEAFRTAVAATLAIEKSKVHIESHVLNGLTLTVNFYVEVEAGSAAETNIMASLDEIATGGHLSTKLMTELGEALQDVAGLDVTVGAVRVSAPEKGTVFVVDEGSSSTGGTDTDEEGGGSMGMIIGIVVVILLLGIGVVAVKVKSK